VAGYHIDATAPIVPAAEGRTHAEESGTTVRFTTQALTRLFAVSIVEIHDSARNLPRVVTGA